MNIGIHSLELRPRDSLRLSIFRYDEVIRSEAFDRIPVLSVNRDSLNS
jgi:hypothetical protein